MCSWCLPLPLGGRHILIHDSISPPGVYFISINLVTFKDFIYLLLEREGEAEKHSCKRVTSISLSAPTGDQACNPGMCPSWASNQQPSALWDSTQPTEPRWTEQPDQDFNFQLCHGFHNSVMELFIWCALTTNGG